MLEELRGQMRYEPETGHLYWKISKKGVTKGRRVSPSPNSDGYMQCVFNGEHYYQHVLIWFYVTGRWPDPCIDHINRIRWDNRWENLREATHRQNQYNSSKRPSLSGHRNVNLISNGSYVVTLRVDGKITNFGTYWDKETAIRTAENVRKIVAKQFALPPHLC